MTYGLFLSATDKKPMYLQIVEQITSKVLLGDWPAQMALPSIRITRRKTWFISSLFLWSSRS